MFNPRWNKVFRDIWLNKARAILVVLSIGIGVFAVGMVAHMQAIVSQDLVASYTAVNPAQIIIHTAEGFDEEFVIAMRRLAQVQQADGRRSTIMKFKLHPDDEWNAIRISALYDYEQIEVNLVKPEIVFEPDPAAWPNPNVWPPPDQAILIERTSLLLADLGFGRGAHQGDMMLLDVPGGRQRQLPMVGLAYDFSQTPATFAGMAYGFVTFDTLEWLGLPRDFNELHLVVDRNNQDWEQIKQLSRELQDRVERAGYTVTKVETPEPGKLPLHSLFQAITLVLGVMGAFSLFLAIFLVVNTVSALLTQQVKQIGVMKSIGARPYQLAVMYLLMVMVFGVLSLIIAVPAAAFFAYHAIYLIAYFINFEMGGFYIAPQALLLQIMVAVFVPILAALYPVYQGVRITIREAISDQGIRYGRDGGGVIDRLIESIQGLPRPLLLSLRNTFRQKVRLGLTLLTLSLAGAVVIGVISVRASMNSTLEDSLTLWQFDVQTQFSLPYRAERLEYLASQVDGVVHAESWANTATFRVRADDSQSESFTITAPPAGSQLLQPDLIDGRWLQPTDTNQLVINNTFLAFEPDIQMGDEITLRIKGRDTTWQVIGVIKTVGNVPAAYANYQHLTTVTREVGLASSVQIQLDQHDPLYQAERANALEAHFLAAGLLVSSKLTSNQLRDQSGTFFNIIATILMMMAGLMSAVGGLGLAGTMSLNVLERRRELGVMRAVGASDEAVLQIFLVEGLFIGLISWLIGFILAIPLGSFLSQAVGLAFLNAPLSYTFSINGAVVWLVAVCVIAAVATYIPAQQASQVSIREVLAYE